MKDNKTYAASNSIYHRAEILSAETCGCYYCRQIFDPKLIEDWTDFKDDKGQPCEEGRTALCPYCGIDAVIGSTRDHVVDDALLKKLHQKMFWDD